MRNHHRVTCTDAPADHLVPVTQRNPVGARASTPAGECVVLGQHLVVTPYGYAGAPTRTLSEEAPGFSAIMRLSPKGDLRWAPPSSLASSAGVRPSSAILPLAPDPEMPGAAHVFISCAGALRGQPWLVTQLSSAASGAPALHCTDTSTGQPLPVTQEQGAGAGVSTLSVNAQPSPARGSLSPNTPTPGAVSAVLNHAGASSGHPGIDTHSTLAASAAPARRASRRLIHLEKGE